MCLIFFSINHHPVYKLIVAANRDEFYERKTSSAQFWQDNAEIIGGIDLEGCQANGECGTWLGMTRSGRISMLTNYRDPKNINPKAPSRGHLVSDFLRSDLPPQAYLEKLVPAASLYNGFNLIVGNISELYYYSNYKEGISKIDPGFYGLSNELLETPWPKVLRGKEKLKPVLQQTKIEEEELFQILYDDQQAPDDILPDTGVGLDRERALSSMFIKTPNYGSRCSTVILINAQNEVLFSERVYDLKTFHYTTSQFQWKLS